MASENPIQAATLFKPLCEVIWRTTAHVIVSLSGLSCSAEGLPTLLPKDAHGQLRTLLKTLEELSCKFSEARREYLRELAMHRDVQRRLTSSAQQVLSSLEERPVVFYEPLESLLDDPTKQFVRQVVEERIKQELQVGASKSTIEEELAPSKAAREQAEAKVAKLEQENRQLRVAAAKAEDALQRQEQAAHQWKEEAAKAKAALEEQAAALKAAQQQVESLQQAQAAASAERRRGSISEAEEKKRSREQSEADRLVQELTEKLAQREKLLEEVQRKAEQMKQETEAQNKSMALDAERRVKELEAQLSRKPEEKRPEPPPPPPVVVKDDKAEHIMREEAARHLEVERQLQDASRALEKALDEAEARAKKAEARAAAAEAAAAAANARAAAAVAERKTPPHTTKQATPVTPVPIKPETPPVVVRTPTPEPVVPVVVVPERRPSTPIQPVSSPEGGSRTAPNSGKSSSSSSSSSSSDVKKPEPQGITEEDMQEAVDQATQRYKEQIQEQAETIERLKAQLRELKRAKKEVPVEVEQKPPVRREPVPEEPVEQEVVAKGTRWKAKCVELEERCESLQEDKERLEAENASLIAALKENCSEEEVKHVMGKIKAEAPQQQRKKKAFERLYDDAQRRMSEMKAREENLARFQRWVLADVVHEVTGEEEEDSVSMARVSMLQSLQKASEATNNRFFDAVRRFQALRVSSQESRLRRSSSMPTVEEGTEHGQLSSDQTSHRRMSASFPKHEPLAQSSMFLFNRSISFSHEDLQEEEEEASVSSLRSSGTPVKSLHVLNDMGDPDLIIRARRSSFSAPVRRRSVAIPMRRSSTFAASHPASLLTQKHFDLGHTSDLQANAWSQTSTDVEHSGAPGGGRVGTPSGDGLGMPGEPLGTPGGTPAGHQSTPSSLNTLGRLDSPLPGPGAAKQPVDAMLRRPALSEASHHVARYSQQGPLERERSNSLAVHEEAGTVQPAGRRQSTVVQGLGQEVPEPEPGSGDVPQRTLLLTLRPGDMGLAPQIVAPIMQDFMPSRGPAKPEPEHRPQHVHSGDPSDLARTVPAHAVEPGGSPATGRERSGAAKRASPSRSGSGVQRPVLTEVGPGAAQGPSSRMGSHEPTYSTVHAPRGSAVLGRVSTPATDAHNMELVGMSAKMTPRNVSPHLVKEPVREAFASVSQRVHHSHSVPVFPVGGLQSSLSRQQGLPDFRVPVRAPDRQGQGDKTATWEVLRRSKVMSRTGRVVSRVDSQTHFVIRGEKASP